MPSTGILVGLMASGTVTTEAFVSPPSRCDPSRFTSNTARRAKKRRNTERLPQAVNINSSTSVFYRDERDEDPFDMAIQRSPPPSSSNANTQKKKQSSAPSDFQSRMKRIVVNQKRGGTSSSATQRRNTSLYRPKNVKSATSLEEFADVIEEGRRDGKVVVVRFYATWCKVSWEF